MGLDRLARGKLVSEPLGGQHSCLPGLEPYR
jgi:hypothetical protein